MTTDYSNLSNKELCALVANKENPTDLELEFMQRVDAMEEHVDDLHELAAIRDERAVNGNT